MGERGRTTRILVGHFFRRFFDNDTVQVGGDTQTTVARAGAIAAVPGLMVAFFLQNQYWRSPPWIAIEDRYFFVLFSFVAMGGVAIFEWEMLFPDRADFLILSPLPVKPREMLAAKAGALAGFLGLFLVAANLFGAIILPTLLYKGDIVRRFCAHGAAVLLAGVFAALFFLALGGVLLCVLGGARFRMVSPAVQMLSVMGLVLLMLQYGKYGDAMQAWVAQPRGMARWLPPLWFLGVYEQLLHGAAAPAFAPEMTRYALRGTAIAGVAVLLTYPVAWVRMRKLALEGSSRRRGQAARWLGRLVHGVVRRPGERAVFHFIGQTMARNNRYQVYLAIYCGSGLALAAACATTFRLRPDSVEPAISNYGLHALMPLLLFWAIAGLRTAFAFPLDLRARWIFRIPGVTASEISAAARKWAGVCAVGVMGGILGVLGAAGWSGRLLLVQAGCGLCLSAVLIDGLFFFQQSVPFTQPRMPGRVSFPLMLTLYLGLFPLMVLGVIRLEMGMERNLAMLLWLGFAAAVVHTVLAAQREGNEEIEEEMEGYEGEFQLLGLS